MSLSKGEPAGTKKNAFDVLMSNNRVKASFNNRSANNTFQRFVDSPIHDRPLVSSTSDDDTASSSTGRSVNGEGDPKRPRIETESALTKLLPPKPVKALIQSIPGLSLHRNVIRNGQEIMSLLRKCEGWKPVGSAEQSRRVLHFGRAYDYSSRNIQHRLGDAPAIPPFILPLQQLAQEVAGKPMQQCLINEYLPGQGISEHVDKTDVFGDVVVCFSLGSAAVLVFRHPDGRRLDLDVPANSLYMMTGEARYIWTHQMPGRLKDGSRMRNLRVAVTFRNVKTGY